MTGVSDWQETNEKSATLFRQWMLAILDLSIIFIAKNYFKSQLENVLFIIICHLSHKKNISKTTKLRNKLIWPRNPAKEFMHSSRVRYTLHQQASQMQLLDLYISRCSLYKRLSKANKLIQIADLGHDLDESKWHLHNIGTHIKGQGITQSIVMSTI